MSTSIFDNVFYRDVFSTPEMRVVFSDEAQIKAFVRAEIALATAQAEVGVIPRDAAETIARRSPAISLDSALLKSDTERVGYPIVGLVRQLSEKLGDAGRYLHWGATTQDIMDTAAVLQAREAVALIEDQLADVMSELARIARLCRDTPMAGRTHLQHALPTTFGHKVAVWLSSLQRSSKRLRQTQPRAFQAQLGGAVGTLASMGDRGLEVRSAYARILDLEEPDITWHVARDGLVELVQVLAVICGTLGKIGYDVTILMSTEIGEVSEPFSSHRGASSTMPQKRNPISSEILLANARMARGAASLMLDSMVQDLERATGPWHGEWLALPQICLLTAGSLAQAKFMLSGLAIAPDVMKRNLNATRGLIMAEAIMMGLAPVLGRQRAHDEVYAACRDVADHGGALLDTLLSRPAVVSALPRSEISALCEPLNYLGSAGAMVDRVLQRYVDEQKTGRESVMNKTGRESIMNNSGHVDRRVVTLGLLGAICAPSVLRAQTRYPEKPVTIVVPFAAGGPTDVIARTYAEFLSRDLGKTFLVENIAGAGGTIGAGRATRANADGYTLLCAQAGTHVSSVGLYRKLPYNPITDYEYLGLFGDLPQVLIVKRDLPPRDFPAFVDYVRANETKLNVGSAGPGSSSYMGAAMLNIRLGKKVNIVGYRGTGPAMNDLIAGTIDYMVEVSLTATPQIEAKTVRPLAVFRSARVSSLPNVPSTNEFGVQGLDFPVWLGLLAPKGTPKPIVERLNASLRKAAKDQTLRERLAPLGLEAPDDAINTPSGFQAFIEKEIGRWVPLIRQAGLTLD